MDDKHYSRVIKRITNPGNIFEINNISNFSNNSGNIMYDLIRCLHGNEFQRLALLCKCYPYTIKILINNSLTLCYYYDASRDEIHDWKWECIIHDMHDDFFMEDYRKILCIVDKVIKSKQNNKIKALYNSISEFYKYYNDIIVDGSIYNLEEYMAFCKRFSKLNELAQMEYDSYDENELMDVGAFYCETYIGREIKNTDDLIEYLNMDRYFEGGIDEIFNELTLDHLFMKSLLQNREWVNAQKIDDFSFYVSLIFEKIIPIINSTYSKSYSKNKYVVGLIKYLNMFALMRRSYFNNNIDKKSRAFEGYVSDNLEIYANLTERVNLIFNNNYIKGNKLLIQLCRFFNMFNIDYDQDIFYDAISLDNEGRISDGFKKVSQILFNKLCAYNNWLDILNKGTVNLYRELDAEICTKGDQTHLVLFLFKSVEMFLVAVVEEIFSKKGCDKLYYAENKYIDRNDEDWYIHATLGNLANCYYRNVSKNVENKLNKWIKDERNNYLHKDLLEVNGESNILMNKYYATLDLIRDIINDMAISL